jgi:uncharacterized protein DUF4255/carboxypeptidase family protein
MAMVVQIPSTTMLADLDETLRTLLRSELERHGFDRVDIAFEAPAKDWAAQLSSPTLNLFLYDLRESAEHRHRTIDERRSENGAFQSRPPLILDCSYAVTAWAKDVEDEHRLLSQVLAILYAFPRLPEDALVGRLRNGSQRYPINCRVGQARGEGKSDFWSAIGGQYKASIDYVAMLTCEPGVLVERGPEVRSQVVRIRDADGPPGTVIELHRLAGRVTDADGLPQVDAWVALPEVGRFASTDTHGGFRLDRVPPGAHRLVARTRDGEEREIEVLVPGAPADVVIGARVARRRSKR